MEQISNKLVFRHAIRLLGSERSVLLIQLFPAVGFQFFFLTLFSLLTVSHKYQSYFQVYLVIAIALIILISTVVYFREATVELDRFRYLLLMGFSKRHLSLIIIIKWALVIAIGLISGFVLFYLFRLIVQLPGDISYFFITAKALPYSLILFLGIGIALAGNKIDHES